ncbi:MAG: SIS domain-containing protein [Clostridia bacterium]|nr:SIS domain-containing protein [Clostridia bacterium]
MEREPDDEERARRFGKELFWREASRLLERVAESQAEAIRRAAELFADRIERDGVIHAFGTGHSRAFAMELANRAGGLVPFDMMSLEQLVLAGWPPERVFDPELERDPEAGAALLAMRRLEPQDAFIIASNSGVNAAVVEVALRAREAGYPLVAVTSLEHTRRVESRHPGGKRLFELADVVIDNGGPFGDALLELPGGGRACSVSSLTGALVAQMLTAEVIGLLLRRGLRPPVLLSVNVPGGRERNEELRRHYEGRI